MTRNASRRTQPGTRVSPLRRFLRLTRLDRLVDPVAERLGWFRDKRRTGLGEPVGGVFAWWRPAKKARAGVVRPAVRLVIEPCEDRLSTGSVLTPAAAVAVHLPMLGAMSFTPGPGISTSNPPTTAVQTSQEPEQRTAVNDLVWLGQGKHGTPSSQGSQSSAPALQPAQPSTTGFSGGDYSLVDPFTEGGPGGRSNPNSGQASGLPQQQGGNDGLGGGGGGGNVANLPADAPPMSDALGGSPIDPVAPANLPQNDAMVGTGGPAQPVGAPGGAGHGAAPAAKPPQGGHGAAQGQPRQHKGQASSQGSSKAAGNSSTGTSGTTQTTPISGSGTSSGSTAQQGQSSTGGSTSGTNAQTHGTIVAMDDVLKPTSVMVSGNPTQTNLGQAVTLTATVTSSGGTPSGEVDFYDGNTLLGSAALASPMGMAQATLTVTALPAFSNSLTADYLGNSSFAGSDSSVFTEMVKGTSSVSVTSSINPATYGQSVTLTAQVSGNPSGGPTPTGFLTFYAGTMLIGSGSLNSSGQTTISTSSLSVGSDSITASYGGDSNYQASTSPALNQTVNISTSTALSSSVNPVVEGQTLTLTAQVTAAQGTPSGSVSFFDAGSLLGSASLNGSGVATLSLSNLSVGSHADLTAVYGGSTNYAPSTSAPLSEQINQASTSLTLSASPNPGSVGESVSLAVSVSAVAPGSGIPDGTVTLSFDGTSLASSVLSGGAATLVTASLPVGSDTLSVSYSGSTDFLPSSTSLTEQISPVSFTWTPIVVQPPFVYSPGTQNNTVGQSVSLQVQASDPNSLALTYGADNLPPGLSINSASGLISGTVVPPAAGEFGGSFNVSLIAIDSAGASAAAGMSWQVAPSPLQLWVPVSLSALAGDSVAVPLLATDSTPSVSVTFSATGLPAGVSLNSSTGLISGTIAPSAVSSSPDQVVVTATDGNVTVSNGFTWSVAELALAAPSNLNSLVGQSVAVGLAALDNEATPTFSAVNLPAGLSVNSSTGLVSGTIAAGAANTSPFSVTFVASDGAGSVSQSATWSVAELTLADPGNQSNLVGQSVSLQLHSTDQAGTPSYSAVNLPAGLSLNSSTGLISGTIAASAASSTPASVTFVAGDGTASVSQSATWSVAGLSLGNPGNQEGQAGSSVSLAVQASDPVGTPTYSVVNLPAGLSLNTTTGLITGTLGLAASGSSPYATTLTASDGTTSISVAWVWTVTPEVALLNPGAQSNAAGDSVSLALTGSSTRGTLNYSATGLPSGLTVNSSTGLISGTISSTAAQTAPYSVTVSATDGTASNSVTFSWSVATLYLPAPAPQGNLDGDSVSLGVQAHYNGTAPLSYTVVGLPPGLSENSSTGLISGTLSGTAQGNYEVSVTASAGSSTVSQTFAWDVSPRVRVASPGNQSNVGGASVSLAVQASDSASASLTYTAVNLPAGLSINSSTGLIAGTISPSAVSGTPDSVTVSASDGTASASQTFSWSVVPLGLMLPGALQSVEGQSVSVALTGSIADGGQGTWSATNLPAGLSLNASTGLVSGEATSLGTSLVGVTLTEGSNSVSQSLAWQVRELGLSSPGKQTSQEGQSVSLALQGVSADGGSLSYSEVGLPAGLSLNSSTGLISGTVAAGAAAQGPYLVDVSVSDGTAKSSADIGWSISPFISLTKISAQSSMEGNSVSLQVQASDAGSLPVSYSATNLPAGVSINSSTGLLSGVVATGDSIQSPDWVVVTATDGTYTSKEGFLWSVAPATPPAPPVVTDPGTQSNQTGDAINLQVQASDSAGYTLTYTAANLPPGVWINPLTGLISGTVAEVAASSTPYSVTVSASDGVGETTTQSFSWLVNASPLNLSVSAVTAVAGTPTGPITLGTFTTPDQDSWAGEFSATITWGDGKTSEAEVSGSNEQFTLTAGHTYEQTGSLPVSIALTNWLTGASTSASGTASVTAAPWTVSGGFEQGVVLGEAGNLVLGTITDSDPAIAASDFSVQITPGDGNPAVTGMVTALGDGLYSISMGSTYSLTGTWTATLNVTGPTGPAQSAISTVAVGTLYAGQSGTLTVAQVNLGNPNAQASSYTATINWGDGTSSAGTVSVVGGELTVQGTHAFAFDSLGQTGGAFQVSVQVSGSSGVLYTGSQPVVVVRPPLQVQVANVVANGKGVVANQVVATFEESDTSSTPSEFTAIINWGDGTSSAGTITEANGIFQVLGGHTYAKPGKYDIEVNVSQSWDNSAQTAVGTGKVDDTKQQIATLRQRVAKLRSQLAAQQKKLLQLEKAATDQNTQAIREQREQIDTSELLIRLLEGRIQGLQKALENQPAAARQEQILRNLLFSDAGYADRLALAEEYRQKFLKSRLALTTSEQLRTYIEDVLAGKVSSAEMKRITASYQKIIKEIIAAADEDPAIEQALAALQGRRLPPRSQAERDKQAQDNIWVQAAALEAARKLKYDRLYQEALAEAKRLHAQGLPGSARWEATSWLFWTVDWLMPTGLESEDFDLGNTPEETARKIAALKMADQWHPFLNRDRSLEAEATKWRLILNTPRLFLSVAGVGSLFRFSAGKLVTTQGEKKLITALEDLAKKAAAGGDNVLARAYRAGAAALPEGLQAAEKAFEKAGGTAQLATLASRGTTVFPRGDVLAEQELYNFMRQEGIKIDQGWLARWKLWRAKANAQSLEIGQVLAKPDARRVELLEELVHDAQKKALRDAKFPWWREYVRRFEALLEVEAYDAMLAVREELRLTSTEVKALQTRRQAWLTQLSKQHPEVWMEYKLHAGRTRLPEQLWKAYLQRIARGQ